MARIRLSDETRSALDRLARLNRTTITALIREAIESYAADCSEARVFRTEPSWSASPNP